MVSEIGTRAAPFFVVEAFSRQNTETDGNR